MNGTASGSARERWKNALSSEIAFWEAIGSGSFPNPDWIEEFRTRATKGAEWRADLTPFLANGRVTRILDVGAGPHTHMGTRNAPGPLEIVPIDPLAEEYERILAANGIIPVIRTIPGEAERLGDYGFFDSFDIVFSRNALDHSYDPIHSVEQMLMCCRVGGRILLEGSINEGVKQRYQGLHMWNFEPQADNDLLVWNPEVRVHIRERLGDRADLIASGKDWYRVVVRRLK
jgi:SAM-dependent methyltransferase